MKRQLKFTPGARQRKLPPLRNGSLGRYGNQRSGNYVRPGSEILSQFLLFIFVLALPRCRVDLKIVGYD